ncbi:MAG: glycosyltransferase family 1 protein [Candidatus Aureabacteria bacterium]|nr:glycosyltransferase family 1 protein [Candidatus Auribacterota bacterium]
MTIGIEIQTLIGNPTGVGLYTYHLVRELAGMGGDERYRLFYFDFKRRGCGRAIDNPRFEFRPIRFMPGRFYESLSANLGWPDISWFAGRCDLYHFPNFVIPPLKKGKAVVTVHDLSFSRYPEYTEARNLRRLEKCFRYTLERADAIITISEFSKRELMELYGVPSDRIAVIHLGVSTPRRAVFEKPLPARYFLFVGTVEPRKNLGTLLDAWRIVKKHRPDWAFKLLIAGGHGWNCEPAEAQAGKRGVADDVITIDYVTHEDLPALYRAAEALVFPSFYEGFGLPPLEAMASGTPVIASTAPAIPEVVGDAALMCDPHDPEGIARAIVQIQDDRQLRDSLVARGFERIKLFGWRKTAEETLALYRKLLQREIPNPPSTPKGVSGREPLRGKSQIPK